MEATKTPLNNDAGILASMSNAMDGVMPQNPQATTGTPQFLNAPQGTGTGTATATTVAATGSVYQPVPLPRREAKSNAAAVSPERIQSINLIESKLEKIESVISLFFTGFLFSAFNMLIY